MSEPNWEQLVEEWFDPPAPTEVQVQAVQNLQAMGKQVGGYICGSCPASTERTLALDKLRECVFWAQQAVACNGGDMPSNHNGEIITP